MKQGPTVKAAQASAVNVPTTTETFLCTVFVSTDNPGAVVVLEGNLDMTPGTGTTLATIRIRRGTTSADPLVFQNENPAVVAGTRIVVPIQETDTPGEVASQAYSLSVQQTGATANGTANVASLQATF